MPRMATLAEHPTPAPPQSRAGSVPPPTTSHAAPEGPGTDELTAAQAEAIARVAALAATPAGGDEHAPSGAIRGAVVVLALMVAAIGLLGILVALG